MLIIIRLSCSICLTLLIWVVFRSYFTFKLIATCKMMSFSTNDKQCFYVGNLFLYAFLHNQNILICLFLICWHYYRNTVTDENLMNLTLFIWLEVAIRLLLWISWVLLSAISWLMAILTTLSKIRLSSSRNKSWKNIYMLRLTWAA